MDHHRRIHGVYHLMDDDSRHHQRRGKMEERPIEGSCLLFVWRCIPRPRCNITRNGDPGNTPRTIIQPFGHHPLTGHGTFRHKRQGSIRTERTCNSPKPSTTVFHNLVQVFFVTRQHRIPTDLSATTTTTITITTRRRTLTPVPPGTTTSSTLFHVRRILIHEFVFVFLYFFISFLNNSK